jgi:hypothetical protein
VMISPTLPFLTRPSPSSRLLGKSGPITPVQVEVASQYWNSENDFTKEIDFPPQDIPGFDFTKNGNGTFEHDSMRGSYEVNAERV